MEAHGPSGVGELLQAVKIGLVLAWHNALPHGPLPQLWLPQKRLRCALCNEKIAVIIAVILADSCNLYISYDSYQVLARERLSMLVSDFTWKVGGMSSQFFLISQSHAMMQLFNDTCQSEYTCFYYLAADYLDRLINCDLSWLEPSRRLQWIHESSSHTSISSCDPPGRSGCAELLFDESRLSSQRQGPDSAIKGFWLKEWSTMIYSAVTTVTCKDM